MSAICPAGPPKREQADLGPDAERLAEGRRRSLRAARAAMIASDRPLSAARLRRRPVVRLLGRVAAPAIEAHRRAPCRPRAARDRRGTCASSPSEAASRPAACGARSSARCRRRARSAASCSSGGDLRPNSSSMVSNVQVSPRWLQNTSSMSNGVALKRSATASTSDGATNRNTASGSTKRRISHGQAMRSTFGRARVTQTVRPALVARRAACRCARAAGRPRARPRSRLPAICASMPSWRSQAATPWLSFRPFWQATTTAWPA